MTGLVGHGSLLLALLLAAGGMGHRFSGPVRDGRAGAAVRGDLEGAAPGPAAVGSMDTRITLEAVR